MNPDLHTQRVSINGASGGNAGTKDSAEPPNTGQRQNRLPVGSLSPSQAADESGRFDKKQRKRARRRKNGKPASADMVHSAAKGESRSSLRKNIPADTQTRGEQTLKSDEQKSGKKLPNRRRRSRRKKHSPDNPAVNSNVAAIQAAVNGQTVAGSSANRHAYRACPAKIDNSTQRPHNNHHGNQSHTQKAVHPSGHNNGSSQRHHDQSEQRNHIPQPQVAPYEPPLYAALDLGTNNCRLLIATPSRPGQFRVVDSFSRIVRLGEGFGTSGRLSDQAMHRAIEALKICRDKLESKNIRRRRLIATEACRSAINGVEFLERVREEAGLELEIVDRQTEASLAVSGCGTLVNRETDALVLFDIGGGSSEIALIDVTCRRSSRLAEHITAWTSLPVGVVTLAEKFGGRDVTPENYAEMVAYVSMMLNDFSERNKLGALANSTHFHLLGTSGTVTTLAGIHLGLDRYDRRRVDGMWMGSQDVTDMTAKLLSWDFKTRVANPCIGADRADLVLAGCAILDAIRQIWPSERLLVADRGLREGILTELMSRDGAWRHRRPHQAKETYMKNSSYRDSQTKGRQS